MVGAAEEAAFGKAFGRHTAPLRRREACQVILERPLSLADEDDVLCPPGGLEDVEAEVGDGLFKREDRFRGIGFGPEQRSEEHTSELQSLMRISYAVFCLNKKNTARNSAGQIYGRLTDTDPPTQYLR